MKYKWLRTNGEIITLTCTKPISLEAMQALCGGYIEQVKLKDGTYIMVNEDARSQNLPKNAQIKQDQVEVDLSRTGGYFLGDIVMMGELQEGEFIGMKE